MHTHSFSIVFPFFLVVTSDAARLLFLKVSSTFEIRRWGESKDEAERSYEIVGTEEEEAGDMIEIEWVSKLPKTFRAMLFSKSEESWQLMMPSIKADTRLIVNDAWEEKGRRTDECGVERSDSWRKAGAAAYRTRNNNVYTSSILKPDIPELIVYKPNISFASWSREFCTTSWYALLFFLTALITSIMTKNASS